MFRIKMNEKLNMTGSYYCYLQARYSGFNKHTQKVG